jgi:hypothetical protein
MVLIGWAIYPWRNPLIGTYQGKLGYVLRKHIPQTDKEKDRFVDMARVDEIPAGKMKHVEVNGKEIVIANMNGKFYPLDDRCAHMNAPLSRGNLTGDVVTEWIKN